MAIYSTVVILSIILSQRWFCAYKTIGEVSRYILADAVGILAGTCGVLMLQSVVFTNVGFSAVIIFSSVISFFVLGTISPMVRSANLRKPQSHILNRQ
jgi:O-glycosyl hydrolase